MAIELDDSAQQFIGARRVARLATADSSGRPVVVPICYAMQEGIIYSPVDEKPKSVEARRLKRVRNIEANPRVSLVVDDYSEDWSKLAYVIVSGLAEIIEPDGEHASEHARAVALLREKYAQYNQMAIDRRPIIKIVLTGIKQWTALHHRS